MRGNMNYTASLYTVELRTADARASEIQKGKADLPILSKLECFGKSSHEVRLV